MPTEQSEIINSEPTRKTEAELKLERVAELNRQLEYLQSDPGAVEWGKKFPEKLKADIQRIEDELSTLPKVGKKVEEPKEEKPKKTKKSKE